MSETISQLPLATQANATDLYPATQGSNGPGTGTSRAVSLTQILASVTQGVYNVRNYGTNAAAIQAATNACHAAGGGIVWFPAGNYTVETSINCVGMSNITWAGEGASTVVACTAALNGSDPTLYNDVFNANNLTAVFPSYMANLTWQDMTIDCTLQNATGVPGGATSGYNLCAVECQNVNNAAFRRLTIIKAFGNALVSGSINPLLTAAVAGAVMEDCIFNNCVVGLLPQYGITGSVVQFGAMRAGTIERCQFINSGGPAIDVFNCFGVNIRGNYFSGSQNASATAAQNVNGIHSDFGLQDCSIEDNTFLLAGGIILNGLMTPNAFNGQTPTPGPLHCSISHNKIYGAATHNQSFQHIALSGGSDATHLGSASDNVIDGNVSYQAPGNGILLTDGLRNDVINNTIKECGAVSLAGIAFQGFDSGQPGGGSKNNRFHLNTVIDVVGSTHLAFNYGDNGANNTGNRVWDCSLSPTITGPLFQTTAVWPTGIPGTSNADNAAAGYVGEYVSAVVLVGSAIALTTATPANITSISLTAGDWDVSATLWLSVGAGGATVATGGITSVSATIPPDPSVGSLTEIAAAITATSIQARALAPARFSLATTTVVYLVAQVSFPSGTTSGYGSLRARRMR